jgi:hypothetical protein
MRDEPAEAKEHVEKPRYRISYETSADSPEELDRKVAKGMARHLKRKGRKSTRKSRR